VVGATSGDTGSSAEYAAARQKNIKVFMLSPQGRMSAFQTHRCTRCRTPTSSTIAVRGVFDDCQDIVKAISAILRSRRDTASACSTFDHWARRGAGRVLLQGVFAVGGEASFAVLGELRQRLRRARRQGDGLPIRNSSSATNENDA